MKKFALILIMMAALAALLGAAASAAAAEVISYAKPVPAAEFDWQTVVNNGDKVPIEGDKRKFNSYNPPSLNVDRLVVFRARTKGGKGGQPVHGVFTRDMRMGTDVVTMFDRATPVPQPNNLSTTFIEPPSFPRIDMWSETFASRGNHQPAWTYPLADGSETRAGTTGIYTDPFEDVIAGTSNLGAVPGFEFFKVPGSDPAVKFDVFPGAPAVTDDATVVFKGNHTEAGVGKTGVYYRDLADASITLTLFGGTTLELAPAGGMSSVVRIADTDTIIPGTAVPFGSTAPPSAAERLAVFAGFDNEQSPTKGGIYLAPLTAQDPPLTALVEIGGQVPGEKKRTVFNRLGEGLSFDGRFVAFWGAWDAATGNLVLQCPEEGNAARLAYCRELYPDGYATTVPMNQGIFVHDIVTGSTTVVAKSPSKFSDFVYWNFSGRVPGVGEGGEGGDDAGELARWRSASFLAVSGLADGSSADAGFHVAFKARTGRIVRGAYVDPIDGIYLFKGPGMPAFTAVVETGMDGSLIDPEAPMDAATDEPATVTEMGIERDGFRGDSMAVNVRMGAEESETGWAGIYLTSVPAALK